MTTSDVKVHGSVHRYATDTIVNITMYQSFDLFAASLPVFMAGIVLGWPSPVMDYISKGRAPVPLTEEQISWMVVCIDIGNFFMAIPAGRLMDGIGRKFTVYLSAPLMFVGWMFILFGRQVRTRDF